MQYKVSRVALLKEAVVKVTQILTNSGIEVRQQGVEARVEYDPKTHLPKRVFLPNLSEDSPDELCDAVQGFLDHEVGHVLFSDGNVLSAATSHKNPELKTLFNLIEDVRIEREMVKMFKGSASHLDTVRGFYWDKFVLPGVKAARAAKDINKEAAHLTPSVVRALGDQFVMREKLDELNSPVAQVIEKMFAPYKDEILNAASTQDSLDLALRITKEMPPPPPAGGGGGGDDQEGDEESEENDKSGSKSKSKSKKSDKQDPQKDKDKQDQKKPAKKTEDDGSDGEDEEGDGDEGEDEDQNGDGEDQNGDGDGDEGDDAEDQGDGSDGEGEGQDGDDGDQSDSSPSDSGKPQDAQLARAALGQASDFDGSMAEIIGKLAIDKTLTSEYTVFTTDNDVIKPLPVSPSRAHELMAYKRIEENVASMVSPMQKDLERAIAARSLQIKTAGHRSGRLNASSLSRLRFNDDRVFARKQISNTKDTAVSLVVDISGSMSERQSGGRRKVEIAAEAAYALSATLERLGVKHEVICFTTKTAPREQEEARYKQADKYGRSDVRYSRYEPIYMPVIKGFDERIDQTVRARFGALSGLTGVMRNNVDGEAIEYAALRLVRQKPTRKIMMVLSDGQPNFYTEDSGAPHSDLLRRTKKIESAKIDLLGIGICDSSVKDYYTNHVVLRDAKELPGTVIREIKKLLMK